MHKSKIIEIIQETHDAKTIRFSKQYLFFSLPPLFLIVGFDCILQQAFKHICYVFIGFFGNFAEFFNQLRFKPEGTGDPIAFLAFFNDGHGALRKGFHAIYSELDQEFKKKISWIEIHGIHTGHMF